MIEKAFWLRIDVACASECYKSIVTKNENQTANERAVLGDSRDADVDF